MTKLGVIFTADRPPETLAAFAVKAEAGGLDALWVWEDCFLSGGSPPARPPSPQPAG